MRTKTSSNSDKKSWDDIERHQAPYANTYPTTDNNAPYKDNSGRTYSIPPADLPPARKPSPPPPPKPSTRPPTPPTPPHGNTKQAVALKKQQRSTVPDVIVTHVVLPSPVLATGHFKLMSRRTKLRN